MSTPYADPNRYRRVDLNAEWREGRGGLDNVDGTSPFHSISKDASHRDRTTSVPLVGEAYNHPFTLEALFTAHPTSVAATLRDYYVELLSVPAPEPPDLPDPDALGAALGDLRDGRITGAHAAERCGVTLHQLRGDITPRLARLVAQATRGRATTRPPGQQSLFDDTGADELNLSGELCQLVGYELAGQLAGVDLGRLATVWVARERARVANATSDPDFPRLLWLRYGLHQRWTLQALAAVDQLAGWEHGIVAALRVLRSEVHAAQQAYEALGGLPDGDPNAAISAIGGVQLWEPVEAHRALTRFRNGVPISPRRLRALVEPAPTHPGDISEGALRALCRRRGWLTADYGAEPTYRERALRPVRAAGGRRLPDGAIRAWARDGDPSVIVAAMSDQDPTAKRTDWELGTPNPDAVQATAYLDALARVVYERFTGERITPRSFAAAVFWREPLATIKAATSLDGLRTERTTAGHVG